MNAKNELEYEQTAIQIIGDIQDTHANLWGGNNKIEDCIIVQSEKAHLVLQLNEKNIPCNPFVQEVLKNTILGIIKTLKIEEKEISEIDIKILVNSKETKEIFHE